MRKKLIMGNWKMNKNKKEILDFIDFFNKNINNERINCNYGVAPSSIYLDFTKEYFKNKNIIICSQDAHYETNGAFTGNDSWTQLKDIGIKYSIIGHSERREMFGDTNDLINKKVKKLLEENMFPILCVGESLYEREKNIHKKIVDNQIDLALKDIKKENLKNLIIAYEPIWAIGTGKSATSNDAQEMCLNIRNKIKSLYNDEISNNILILYGGSVNENNGKEYLSQNDIDGALVGGASLDAEKFINLLKVV